MKINSVKIRNFKQFLTAEFSFSDQGPGSPFGLLVGSNMAGKTTFLSTLFFAFHGSVLESLDDPKHLCNQEVFNSLSDGEDAKIEVEIDFETGGVVYTVKRSLTVRRMGQSENRVDENVEVFNHQEKVKETPPQLWLNRVFPANLAKFLFFPGEQLEDFFNPEKFAGFVGDIKTLSGLDKLDLLQAGIGGALDRIDKRIRNIPGNDQNQLVIDSLRGCELELAQKTDAEQAATSSLLLMQTRHSELKETLEANQDQFDEITLLNALRGETSKLEADALAASVQVTDLYARFGWSILAADLQDSLQSALEKFSKAGSLNRNWPATNIRAIIAEGTCICGCNLSENSEHSSRLQNLLENRSDLESNAPYFELQESLLPDGQLNFSAQAKKIEDAWTNVERCELALQNNSIEISKLLGSTGGSVGDESLQVQLRELVELDQNIPRAKEECDGLKNRVLELRAKQSELQRTLESNLSASIEHSALVTRRKSLSRIVGALRADADNIRLQIQNSMREILEVNLPPIFNFEPIEVHVNSEFGVEISSRAGAPIAMAEGQRKSLAFAIIAALTDIAGQVSRKVTGSEGAQVENFPLVIDAGFAELADYFSKYPLEWLKKSSNQVILISLPQITSRLSELIPPGEIAFKYLLTINAKSPGHENELWGHEGKMHVLRRFGQEVNSTTAERIA